jgi:carbon-monoxide dehydrogenase medium subunit
MKAQYNHNAVFWAGGTDLLLNWQRGTVDFEYCIDLSYLDDLRYIRKDERGTAIGALVNIASLAANKNIDNGQVLLQSVASQFATPQIRNVATLGGNICHAVPSADFAAPLLALDAELKIMSVSGERTLPVAEFFKNVKQTALHQDELLVEIWVPHLPPHSECTFQRITRTSVDIALVNVAVRMTVNEEGSIILARIALGAVAPTPIRSLATEEMLIGMRIDEINDHTLEQVSARAAADTRPISDVRTSATYRKQVGKVLVKRNLNQVIKMLGRRVK